MKETDIPNDAVWSIPSHYNHEKDPQKKGNSKATIVVCSLIVLGVTAALTVWVFAVRPNFYPQLKIMSRSDGEVVSLQHHIKRRSDVDVNESEFIGTEAEVRSSIKKRRGKKPAPKRQTIRNIYEEATAEDFPYKGTRLPRNLLPTDYYISLDVNLGKDSYTGAVSIDLICKKDTKFVIFHGRKIRIGDVSLASTLQSDKLKVKKILHYAKTEMFLVEATENFRKGKKYVVKIEFEADFNPSLAGFYKSKYRGKDGIFRLVINPSHLE